MVDAWHENRLGCDSALAAATLMGPVWVFFNASVHEKNSLVRSRPIMREGGERGREGAQRVQV